MSSPAVHNFMRQQGFAEEPEDACDMHFEGLYYQPRRVFPTILLATALQLVSVPLSAALFFLVSAVLWWNTLVPSLNPFEVAYNRLVAGPRGLRPLTPAPGPRRFAQGMAAAMTLGSGAALLAGAPLVAWVLQALLASAFSLLLFGKFCLGAYVFHLLKGRVAFANSTLPWAR
ncbi:MAG TPA: DUF4395 family protein, partial [Vicinamibacteria bacterium]